MTRDEIQEKLSTQILPDFRGIHLISVRTGKCRVYLKCIQKASKPEDRVLVLYPNTDIRKSWEDECVKLNYFPDITYSTYLSADKVMNEKWDWIVCDEAQLIGEENQLPKIGELARNNKRIVLASGTYSSDTLQALCFATDMTLDINYSTEQAIEDGIVNNFNVFVHTYQLDNETKITFGTKKKWTSTEKKECGRLSYKVDVATGEAKKFAALNRMRFINSCSSLVGAVNHWMNNNKDRRFLLFTGDEKMGKRFNIPMYNSKSSDDSVLQDFQNEKINQLCLIKKGSTGITYKNLDTIVITAINSNGEHLEQQIARSLLMDTDEANIHIFVSDEPFQQKWLNKALSSINKNRIFYDVSIEKSLELDMFKKHGVETIQMGSRQYKIK